MALVALEQSFPKDQRIVDDNLAYRMLLFGVRIFACALRPRLDTRLDDRPERKEPTGPLGRALMPQAIYRREAHQFAGRNRGGGKSRGGIRHSTRRIILRIPNTLCILLHFSSADQPL